MHMQNRKFYFHRIDPANNIDTWERVVEEVWQWEAIYTDGTVLRQFDDSTKAPEQFGPDAFVFHQFKEIDQSRLKIFKMVRFDKEVEHVMFFDPAHMELVHMYRRIVLEATTENEKRLSLYVYGYKNTVKRPGEYGGDVTITNLNVITPEGTVVTTDSLDNITVS